MFKNNLPCARYTGFSISTVTEFFKSILNKLNKYINKNFMIILIESFEIIVKNQNTNILFDLTSPCF